MGNRSRSPSPALLAPGASSSAGSLRLPSKPTGLPAVDDHIAPPETRVEYLGGAEIFAAPAQPPHAMQHWDLTYVLGGHVAKGYRGAVDMLTRTGEASDFAPDASIFPIEPDPVTGGRQLEELAFEVADKQSIGVPTKKARELIARGVRRVFCVLVGKGRVLEWSRDTDGWEPLPKGALIEDRCLVRAMPIDALLNAAGSDDAVARALLEKSVPALENALAEIKAEGKAEGKSEAELQANRDAILIILRARDIEVTPALAGMIAACQDSELLRAWVARAATAGSASVVVSTPNTDSADAAKTRKRARK